MITKSSLCRGRRLCLQPLESRMMLSHPTVTAVNLCSTDWSSAFVSHLESQGLGVDGYAVPAGASQLQTLPWNNLNQVRITFSEDVVVSAECLSISGVNTTAYAFDSFSYDATSHVAVWTLASDLSVDKLMLDLDADGMAPVRSASTADVLDGAWVDGQSTFPSGNSTGGTDFQFSFNVAPGDANASNSVTSADVIVVRNAIGTSVGDSGYNPRYDIDGSGSITDGDRETVVNLQASTLPTGNPTGMSNDAPTTAGIADLPLAAGAADYVLALSDLFDDAETLSEDLAYSIVGNSNSSLFTSLSIDSSGDLTVDLNGSNTGYALLTLRATDSVGLFVETTLAMRVSAPPVISNWACVQEMDQSWTISGTVTDADDSVLNDTVYFGGVFAPYYLMTSVAGDGSFLFNVFLPGLEEGLGTAQTTDPNGVHSEINLYYVVV